MHILYLRFICRPQRSRGLRHRSAVSPLLGLRVRIPPEARMSVSYERSVLSRTSLCVGLITCPEESYAVNSPDYTESNGGINSQKTNQKGRERSGLGLIGHYPGIYLQRLRKATKKPQDIFLGLGFELGTSQCETQVLHIGRQRLVLEISLKILNQKVPM